MSVVRPFFNTSMPRVMRRSVSTSILLVASSKIKILGLNAKALAKQMI